MVSFYMLEKFHNIWNENKQSINPAWTNKLTQTRSSCYQDKLAGCCHAAQFLSWPLNFGHTSHFYYVANSYKWFVAPMKVSLE